MDNLEEKIGQVKWLNLGIFSGYQAKGEGKGVYLGDKLRDMEAIPRNPKISLIKVWEEKIRRMRGRTPWKQK